MKTFDEWMSVLPEMGDELQPTAEEILHDWHRERFSLKNQIHKPTRDQLRNMLADFLWRNYRGQQVDAMEATLTLQEHWGYRIDWHEFSSVLDEMANRGYIKVVNGSGNVTYYIPRTGEK